MQTIYLAGGCFWGLEAYFDRIDGVLEAVSGYANGDKNHLHYANPSYQQVIDGSGHAETVKVTFDPNTLSLATLLQYYFQVIDPISINQQGNDKGIQYRTGIYYVNDDHVDIINNALTELQKQFSDKLAIENQPLDSFYPAEEYHQKYLAKNPNGYCHIDVTLADKGID